MVEIYNKEKAFTADARCQASVIALYLISVGSLGTESVQSWRTDGGERSLLRA